MIKQTLEYIESKCSLIGWFIVPMKGLIRSILRLKSLNHLTILTTFDGKAHNQSE